MKIINNCEFFFDNYESPVLLFSGGKLYAVAGRTRLFAAYAQKKENISLWSIWKRTALLQFSKMNNNLIDFVFDKSKLQQGLYTPGTNIKIKNPKYISRKNVDYLLILSWNIKKEIIKQEKKFLKNGGKFLIPFPQPKIIS